MSIYLDYNASAPIDEAVLDTMIDVYRNHIGNADSRTRDYGDQARGIVETARKQVASLLGISQLERFLC
ncbi:MAG: aminotransferase class V-fold PLP-dependent enzyme [Coprococcus sp.]